MLTLEDRILRIEYLTGIKRYKILPEDKEQFEYLCNNGLGRIEATLKIMTDYFENKENTP